MSQTYATGLVSVAEFFEFRNEGGLVGSNTGSVSASYWDTTTTAQEDALSGDGMTGLTTAEFQDRAGFMALAEAAGWDFEAEWAPPSTGHYPELYAISPVVRSDALDTSSVYGSVPGPYSANVYGGPDSYASARPATPWMPPRHSPARRRLPATPAVIR